MEKNLDGDMLQEEKLLNEAASMTEEDAVFDLETSRKVAFLAAKTLDEKQGQDIRVIDIHERSVLADYFVITEGKNPNHVRSLMDAVEDRLTQEGYEPLRTEGGENTNAWILMDYNGVIIHIFNGESRRFYNLEKLWSDGVLVDPSEWNR